MKHLFYAIVAVLIAWACNSEPEHEHGASASGAHAADGGGVVVLDAQQQRVANVTIDTVRSGTIDEIVTLLGTTAVNENNTIVVSARLKGRVDALYVKNPGQNVLKGAPLYRIYSEELLADEHAHLAMLQAFGDTILQQDIANRMLQASRRKLVLWGVGEPQIRALERQAAPSPLLTVFSDYGGALTELMVSEGQYVDAGTPMFELTDLSELWVETQFYAQDVAFLQGAHKVEVEFASLPNQFFPAKLAFDNPVLDESSKVNRVRYRLKNPGLHIKPGEMAYVHLIKASRPALIVPRSAVVYETTPAVWVATDAHTFEKRMVRLGIQNKKEVEVLDGLTAGERIAATGSYLINSAHILQHGTGTMGGMKM